ncbi:AraC family transcriptional regulator [Verrucomicrobium spinosum]|uniref:AraC family transcriptional regulator n=1 Tax=Verrucomicrobium spinosum TaxID=2736 RepID=UPI0009D799EB|nr:AraC family transcriptional regulator [Verrucomicrobium spinosum]
MATKVESRRESFSDRCNSFSDRLRRYSIRHGFCDQSTFAQHFRKRMGMTPLQFRKQYKR